MDEGVLEEEHEAITQKITDLQVKIVDTQGSMAEFQEADKAKRQKLNTGEAVLGEVPIDPDNPIALELEAAKAELHFAQTDLEQFVAKRKHKAATKLLQKAKERKEAAKAQATGSQPEAVQQK